MAPASSSPPFSESPHSHGEAGRGPWPWGEQAGGGGSDPSGPGFRRQLSSSNSPKVFKLPLKERVKFPYRHLDLRFFSITLIKRAQSNREREKLHRRNKTPKKQPQKKRAKGPYLLSSDQKVLLWWKNRGKGKRSEGGRKAAHVKMR